MKIPLMIGTILRNGFENTSAGPVITVWTGVNSTLSHRVSSRMKCAPRCWLTQDDTQPIVMLNEVKHLLRAAQILRAAHLTKSESVSNIAQ